MDATDRWCDRHYAMRTIYFGGAGRKTVSLGAMADKSVPNLEGEATDSESVPATSEAGDDSTLLEVAVDDDGQLDMDKVERLLFDNNMIVAATRAGTVEIFDAESGAHSDTLAKHKSWVWAVDFDATTLLSASRDRSVMLWDIASPGECRYMRGMYGHQGSVQACALHDGGRMALSGSMDRTVRLWDPESGDNTATFRGHTGFVNTLATSPHDVNMVVSGAGGADSGVRVWDLRTRGCAIVLEGAHEGPVMAMAVSPRDGGFIATASHDTTAKVWDLTRPDAPLFVCQGHGTQVNTLAFADRDTLVTGALDGTVRVWLLTDGALLWSLAAHSGGITDVDYVDGLLSTLGTDGALRRWDFGEAATAHALAVEALF